MPRLPRLHLQGVIYLVTLEGPSDDLIFRDSADYNKYVELLRKYKSEYRFKLFSYSFLPNRLHLVIEVDESFPLSVIMQNITPQYTKYYNSKYQKSGHLFPKRFRSVIVEKETFLVPLTKYIHALPKSIGLCADMNYPYGSFSQFKQDASEAPAPVKMSDEVSEVLASFSGDGYSTYVNAVDQFFMEDMDKKFSRPIVGSDTFVEDIKRKISESKKESESNPGLVIEPPALVQTVSRNYARVPLVAALLFSVGLSLYAVSLNRPLFSLPQPQRAMSDQPANRIELNVTEPESKNLNGTIWEVELISVASDGTRQPIRDKITFTGKSFKSHYFSTQGFSPSNYTVTVHDNNMITWETIQTNDKGETVSWRGDLEGKKMEGVLSQHSSNQNAHDFSFFSKGLNPNG